MEVGVSRLVVSAAYNRIFPHRSSSPDRRAFTHDEFRYEPAENAYYCPEGKVLSFKGRRRESHGYLYRSTKRSARTAAKETLHSGPYRRLFVHEQESVRKPSAPCAERQLTSVRSGSLQNRSLFAELSSVWLDGKTTPFVNVASSSVAPPPESETPGTFPNATTHHTHVQLG